MRSDADIEDAIDRYGDMVLRACSAYLSGHNDAEDVFQDTYLKYATHTDAFSDEEHRKAWLIRVAINNCKDRLRALSARTSPLDEADELAVQSETDTIADSLRIRQAMWELTEDQRVSLVLSAVEGYSVPEIADIMGKPQNTVYSHITRGRKRLGKVLGYDGS